jgi:hypothetical protein
MPGFLSDLLVEAEPPDTMPESGKLLENSQSSPFGEKIR